MSWWWSQEIMETPVQRPSNLTSNLNMNLPKSKNLLGGIHYWGNYILRSGMLFLCCVGEALQLAYYILNLELCPWFQHSECSSSSYTKLEWPKFVTTGHWLWCGQKGLVGKYEELQIPLWITWGKRHL